MKKTKLILNVEDKTYHALDEGRVLKAEGKVNFDMNFATTEETGVVATGKGDITYTTTAKKKPTEK